MTVGILVVGLAGGLVGLAALLAVGLGPVVALMVFWIAGLAVTVALAADFARNTILGAAPDERPTVPKPNDGA